MKQRLVLLKLETSDRRIFFVLKQPRYDHHGTPEYGPEQDRYFYEEHSCPTNWFYDIAAVIEDGNADPHGFLKFVRAIDVPEGFNPDSPGADNGPEEAEVWGTLFSEIFDKDGVTIDGTAINISNALPAIKG